MNNYNIYKKIQENERKNKERRLTVLMDKILDIFETEEVSVDEMANVLANLQINYSQMLLSDIKKLKDERNT